ncbi:MAG: hypothetical protein GX457_15370 [Thermotogaceae bacterium]|nr:hypothetical protein [Thermotogaceae bacterium]
MKDDMIRLTGLWKSKDKNGNTYLSGNLTGITSLMVMPNTFKKKDSEPDYIVYLKASEKRQRQAGKGEEL